MPPPQVENLRSESEDIPGPHRAFSSFVFLENSAARTAIQSFLDLLDHLLSGATPEVVRDLRLTKQGREALAWRAGQEQRRRWERKSRLVDLVLSGRKAMPMLFR